MAEKRWKRAERIVAKKTGGKRNLRKGVEEADVTGALNGRFVLEVKSRETLPAWITRGYMQAKRHADREGKIAALVIKEKNKKDELVVMRLSDLIREIGG